jgi:hypothetical protein
MGSTNAEARRRMLKKQAEGRRISDKWTQEKAKGERELSRRVEVEKSMGLSRDQRSRG